MLDRAGVAQKAELERRHWWYRGRRKVVEAALGRLMVLERAEILDLGCGSGEMLELLSSYGTVSGVDVNPHAVEWARRRGLGDVREASAEDLPHDDRRFDLVTCLDVLEHLDDDAAGLPEIARVPRSAGLLLVTVPAYPRLFSGHDVAAGHARRYRFGDLVSLAERGGWS